MLSGIRPRIRQRQLVAACAIFCSTVVLVSCSTTPELVHVPNEVHKSVSVAKRDLEQRGLKVQLVVAPGGPALTSGHGDDVLSQTPSHGSLKRGATVKLLVRH